MEMDCTGDCELNALIGWYNNNAPHMFISCYVQYIDGFTMLYYSSRDAVLSFLCAVVIAIANFNPTKNAVHKKYPDINFTPFFELSFRHVCFKENHNF